MLNLLVVSFNSVQTSQLNNQFIRSKQIFQFNEEIKCQNEHKYIWTLILIIDNTQ